MERSCPRRTDVRELMTTEPADFDGPLVRYVAPTPIALCGAASALSMYRWSVAGNAFRPDGRSPIILRPSAFLTTPCVNRPSKSIPSFGDRSPSGCSINRVNPRNSRTKGYGAGFDDRVGSMIHQWEPDQRSVRRTMELGALAGVAELREPPDGPSDSGFRRIIEGSSHSSRPKALLRPFPCGTINYGHWIPSFDQDGGREE
jgi:hypothetical protein